MESVSAEGVASGVSAAVYSFPWVKPIDANLIHRLAQTLQLLVTVEEAINGGGFGGAVAESLTTHRRNTLLLRLGIP